jgi:arabinan endo-1,5-alpha-L-arabinosidase
MELDPDTGLRHPRDGGLRRIAWHESIEAPAILKHGGYYHLFVNWGACCRGVDSTYEIRIGRSREITGPYLDRDGRDMAVGGGTLLLGTAGDRIGPGHASFIRVKDDWLMFYHYYDRARRGTPALGWKRLSWTADGWPQIR